MHAVSASLRAWASPATTSSNDHSSLGNGPIAIVSAGSRPAAGTFDSYVGGKARSASAAVGAARRKKFFGGGQSPFWGCWFHSFRIFLVVSRVFVRGKQSLSPRCPSCH